MWGGDGGVRRATVFYGAPDVPRLWLLSTLAWTVGLSTQGRLGLYENSAPVCNVLPLCDAKDFWMTSRRNVHLGVLPQHCWRLATTTAAIATLIVLAGCAAEPAAQGPADASHTPTSTPTVSPTESAQIPQAAHVLPDEASGTTFLSNNAMVPLEARIDVAGIVEAANASVELSTGDQPVAADCAQDWEATQYYWLREETQQHAHDYHSGPTAGPTCFTESGGVVTDPEYRLIHHLCQAPHTTARTLFSPDEGQTILWSPEYTTEDHTVCLDFGQEVRAYQAEVMTSLD